MCYNLLVMNNQIVLGKNKFFSKKNRKRKKKILLKNRNLFYRLVRLFLMRHENEIKLAFFLSFMISFPLSVCMLLFADTNYDREMRKPNQDYYRNHKNCLDNQHDSCYYIHRTL